MKTLVLFSLLTFATVGLASGFDDLNTDFVSTSNRSVQLGDAYKFSCTEHIESDGSKIAVAILQLNGLGKLNESVTLASYTMKNCDAANAVNNQAIDLSFTLYNETPVDRFGNVTGETYQTCTVQGTLKNGMLLSAWYWRLNDISACR